eukprot:scaffold870_cov268-Pinguiococcus_pyrenoidosus.AAC.8
MVQTRFVAYWARRRAKGPLLARFGQRRERATSPAALISIMALALDEPAPPCGRPRLRSRSSTLTTDR